MNDTEYSPPLLLSNGHVQTIFPVIFRKVADVCYERERIETDDDDFLDLDWSCSGSDKLTIISHGLEGNSHRAYVKGMVKTLNRHGWDALAWNYRSCGEEPNRQLRFYHNGATDDLDRVIRHAKTKKTWRTVALIGFSLGGNLTLMYLGRDTPDPIVHKAVTFSVPCDLTSAATCLAEPANAIYMKRFLRMLHGKIKAKKALFPDQIDDDGYEKIKDFKMFDDRYTAPIHGFKDARDYWERCSSKPYLKHIDRPCLIINAANDPFLPRACYPAQEVESNPNLILKIPESGGHVGFISLNKERVYWSEAQAVLFLNGGPA